MSTLISYFFKSNFSKYHPNPNFAELKFIYKFVNISYGNSEINQKIQIEPFEDDIYFKSSFSAFHFSCDRKNYSGQ